MLGVKWTADYNVHHGQCQTCERQHYKLEILTHSPFPALQDGVNSLYKYNPSPTCQLLLMENAFHRQKH